MSATELRIFLVVLGVIAIALIYLFGRPKKPGQGKRTPFARNSGGRIEPTLGDGDGDEQPSQGELKVGPMSALDDEPPASDSVEAWVEPERKTPKAGIRPTQPIERIVTLFVAARAGDPIHGTDLVVAAEKAGLVFGDKAIFHRLVSGKAKDGPIFSMANMVQPGSFDMRHIDELQTPGVSFFMTLPGPLPALDAWEAMLPTAERLAELLDAVVLDEERNGLGRQRVAYIRDEMRDWDRKQERHRIR
ncbi:MAG: cell division protein ZipA [Rudaea sp.]